MHVLSSYSKGFNILKCYEYEFALFLIDDVMVAYQLPSLLLPADLVEKASHLLKERVDCESKNSFSNKVHLWNFLVLLVQHLVLGMRCIEGSGHEAQRNVKEELAILHELWLEKSLVLRCDVLIDEVHHHLNDDWLWKLAELYIMLQKPYPVIPIEIINIVSHVLNQRA